MSRVRSMLAKIAPDGLVVQTLKRGLQALEIDALTLREDHRGLGEPVTILWMLVTRMSAPA